MSKGLSCPFGLFLWKDLADAKQKLEDVQFRYDITFFSCHSVRLDKVLEPEQYGAAHITELGLIN